MKKKDIPKLELVSDKEDPDHYGLVAKYPNGTTITLMSIKAYLDGHSHIMVWPSRGLWVNSNGTFLTFL